MSLEILFQRFQNTQIPREQWSHREHLGVALWLCAHYDEAQTLEILRAGIWRLNEANGVENGDFSGYHETLTVFFARVVAEFYRRHRELEIEEIWALLLQEWGDKNRVFEFYPRRALFSPHARRRFVEPWKPLEKDV